MIPPPSDPDSAHFKETVVSSLPVTIGINTYFAPSDVKVYDTLNEQVQLLTLGDHYTLSGNNVVLTSKHFPATSTVATLIRVPISQLASYAPNDDFPAKTHETALDRIVRMIQELNRASLNTLTLDPLSDSSGYLPLAQRKGKFIVFNSDTGAMELSGDLQTAVDTAEGFAQAASNSAGAAAGSASTALGAADDAGISEANAQALYDTYRLIFYGSSSTAPTLRFNGSPLQAGDVYLNTTNNLLYAYNGTTWVAIDTATVAGHASDALGYRNQTAQLKDDVTSLVQAAEGHESGALSSAQAAGLSATQANSAKIAAEGARNLSQLAQSAAESARDQAASSATVAGDFALDAMNYRNTANNHRIDAEQARNQAIAAKDDAQFAAQTADGHEQAALAFAQDASAAKTAIETAFGVLSTDPQAMVKLMYNVHSINLPVDMTIEEDERSLILDELVVASGRRLTVNGKMMIHPYEE